MCTNCGRLYRYAEPDEFGDDHVASDKNTHHAAEPTHDIATSSNNDILPDHDYGQPEDSLGETNSQDEPDDRPQIINHHASSHYRRRLHERIHALERPELEPPDDLTTTQNQTDSLEPVSPAEPDRNLKESALVGAFAAGAWQDGQATETQPAHGSESANEAPESGEEELWGPHKPSPHVLDVASSTPEPEPEENALLPASPLDLRDADTHSTPSQDPAAAQSQLHTPIHTQSRNTPNKDSAALAKADALLAAASTPAPDKRSANLVWLGITAVIVVGLGSFLTFNLLKPASTPQSNTPTPAPSTATQSPTNTQSASAKRDAQRKADLNDIAVGLSAYQKATGKYPVGNDISALQPLTTANPPFIKTIQNDPNNDPNNGVIIKYSYTSDGTTYTLAASLENKNDPDAKNGLYIVKSSSN